MDELVMRRMGKSKLRQAITNGDINIPEAAALPGSASKLPFVIVADDAFPLMPNIMKPYPGSNLSKECLVFNYRLSRARRGFENAFGILAARFRVFGTTILTSVPNTKLIVLAACSLHNFLTNRSKNTHIPEDCADREDILNGVLIEGNWRQNTNPLISCQRISSRGSIMQKIHSKSVAQSFRRAATCCFGQGKLSSSEAMKAAKKSH
ncbi:protein ALP1-like [Trichonephila clavipes]|nr:protein ALP1-like [Trichonephila clavipes]